MHANEENATMRQRQHLLELDGLRGLAVIGVLIAHLRVSYIGFIPVQLAHHGVDLFFVLSGFLITRIRLYEQENGSGLKAFWIKRVTRIFPAAYLYLLLVGMAFGFSVHILMAALFLVTFDLSLFGSANPPPIGHFWTLAIEEQFYLLWPLALLASTRVATKWIAFFCAGSIMLFTVKGVISASLQEHGDLSNLLDHQLLTRGWPLMAGSLIAIFEEKIRHHPRILLQLGTLSGAIGLGFGAVFFVLQKSTAFKVDEFRLMCGQFLALGLFMWVLFAAYRGIVTPFRIAGLRWFGTISYGLYLYHIPIYNAWNVLEHKERWPLAVGLSVLAATLSFYLYERPIIGWGRRLALAQRSPAVATVAANVAPAMVR